MLKGILQILVAGLPFAPNNLRTQKLIQQKIARGLLRRLPSKHKNAIQPIGGSGRRGLAAVIGLHCSGSDQRFGALCAGVGKQKFKFTGFVTAKCQPGLVVALNQDARPAQAGRNML